MSLLAIRALFVREYYLAKRERITLWIMPAFVLLASATLAFALSQVSISSSIIFAANSGLLLCFASMLGLDGWLERDATNETLTIYYLSSHSPFSFICGKFISFLLFRGLPTTLATSSAVIFYPRLDISPLFAFIFSLPILFLCSIALTAIGLFIVALTMHADARSENTLLLGLPLFLPPLMFSISCLDTGLSPIVGLLSLQSSLLLLCGTSLLSLALLPVAAFLLAPPN